MEINRTNYEIWFIDWADNNLSDSRIEELNWFLRQNPDLIEEFNNLSNLTILPDKTGFPDKTMLLKSSNEIPDTQFELLCIACLENDLTPEQRTEICEMIIENPELKKTFDLIKKTRISPPVITFKYKNQLRKKAVMGKLRFLYAGLSAAAVILPALMLFNSVRNANEPDLTIALEDSSHKIVLEIPVASASIKKENNLLPTSPKPNGRIAVSAPDIPIESITGEIRIEEEGISVIALNLQPVIIKDPLNNILAFSDISTKSDSWDDRSRFEKFIARAFRDKIMNEDSPDDAPIKGYEVAEAGISGLNKLLGWEMALSRNNDDKGELESLYFSSKLLKFNAPLRKNESSE